MSASSEIDITPEMLAAGLQVLVDSGVLDQGAGRELPTGAGEALVSDIWLFYVQHQFEGTFWAHGRQWNFHEASLRGSSYYDLPGILRWFTANIGVRHVHHLCCRIPYYRLPQTLRDNPDLRSVSRLTLFQSFRCVRLVLWDESGRRLVSFRDARMQRLG